MAEAQRTQEPDSQGAQAFKHQRKWKCVISWNGRWTVAFFRVQHRHRFGPHTFSEGHGNWTLHFTRSVCLWSFFSDLMSPGSHNGPGEVGVIIVIT